MTHSTVKNVKTPALLAKEMECEMHRAGRDCAFYRNEHCTLFENQLEYICGANAKDRHTKLAEFAAQYGFRLRLYRQGLFAIFGLRTPAAGVGAL